MGSSRARPLCGEGENLGAVKQERSAVRAGGACVGQLAAQSHALDGGARHAQLTRSVTGTDGRVHLIAIGHVHNIE